MKKADDRNMMAPNKSPNLNSLGKSPILRAARLRAAKVPGADAFLIGLIRFSNSSLMQTLFGLYMITSRWLLMHLLLA